MLHNLFVTGEFCQHGAAQSERSIARAAPVCLSASPTLSSLFEPNAAVIGIDELRLEARGVY